MPPRIPGPVVPPVANQNGQFTDVLLKNGRLDSVCEAIKKVLLNAHLWNPEQRNARVQTAVSVNRLRYEQAWHIEYRNVGVLRVLHLPWIN